MVVSATFLLVCFSHLQDSTCETRKNDFFFHFESSFRSLDNQILTFQIFECHDVITCLSMKHTLLNNLGSKHSLVIKFGQYMQYYTIKFFIEKFYEKCGLETSRRPFLGWHVDFGRFQKLCYYISNISGLLQIFHFPIEVALNSLQTKKGMELVFRPQFWYNFLMIFFLL